MWLIAGLGNPGRRYEKTRHNVGFEVVDILQARHFQSALTSKYGGVAATGLIGLEKVMLLKPMEFMNNSGFAVQRACRFHDIPPEKLIVVHDELDLPPARLRVKEGGGHGGNNGLRSIIAQLGTKDFLRVRLGIGKPLREDGGQGEGSTADYVLSQFSKSEQQGIEKAFDFAADAVETLLLSGVKAAMNDFNGVSSRQS